MRCENMPANRSSTRETGLEMPCCPPNDLVWVQITQSYPNRLRFSNLPCPQSPYHTVIDPVFKEGFFEGKNLFSDQTLLRVKQGTKGGGWRSVPDTLYMCRLFQTCRRIGVYLSSEEHLHRSLTRQVLGWGGFFWWFQVSQDVDKSFSSLSRLGWVTSSFSRLGWVLERRGTGTLVPVCIDVTQTYLICWKSRHVYHPIFM